ncbi:MAG: GNAT family N-acetyltransferase [Burkholderiales bacterium]
MQQHPPSIQVTVANLRRSDDLCAAAPLFDAYRQFYGQPSDLVASTQFLRERGALGQSVLLLARTSSAQVVGFSQIYPSFSSSSLASIWVLNDLFVSEAARRCGVARALLAAAESAARRAGAIRLTLKTQRKNRAAQALYEGMQWLRDEEFLTYHLRLDNNNHLPTGATNVNPHR